LSSYSAFAPPRLCVDVPLLRTASRPTQPRSQVTYPYQHRPSHHPAPTTNPFAQDRQGAQRHTQCPIPNPRPPITNPKSPIQNQGYCSSRKKHHQNNITPYRKSAVSPTRWERNSKYAPNTPIYGTRAQKPPVFRAHSPTPCAPRHRSQQSHTDPRYNIAPYPTQRPTPAGGAPPSGRPTGAPYPISNLQYPISSAPQMPKNRLTHHAFFAIMTLSWPDFASISAGNSDAQLLSFKGLATSTRHLLRRLTSMRDTVEPYRVDALPHHIGRHELNAPGTVDQ
jgi:hypothetical protein